MKRGQTLFSLVCSYLVSSEAGEQYAVRGLWISGWTKTEPMPSYLHGATRQKTISTTHDWQPWQILLESSRPKEQEGIWLWRQTRNARSALPFSWFLSALCNFRNYVCAGGLCRHWPGWCLMWSLLLWCCAFWEPPAIVQKLCQFVSPSSLRSEPMFSSQRLEETPLGWDLCKHTENCSNLPSTETNRREDSSAMSVWVSLHLLPEYPLNPLEKGLGLACVCTHC